MVNTFMATVVHLAESQRFREYIFCMIKAYLFTLLVIPEIQVKEQIARQQWSLEEMCPHSQC